MGASGRGVTGRRQRRRHSTASGGRNRKERIMRTRKLTGPLAVTVALAALAVPAAVGAQTTKDYSKNAANGEYVTPAADLDLRSPDARDVPAGSRTDLRSPDAREMADGRSRDEVNPPIVAGARADGFDWGDAGIGAAGAVGLLAISLASAMTLRLRQTRPRSVGTTR
jgi:hypothetical protein